MCNAPHPAEPASQTHQGVGARFFRRFGGAVRQAIAGGIALAGGRRGQAAPQAGRNPAAPQNPAPSSRPRRTRRPHAAAPPAQPIRPGWFARWFGRHRHQPLDQGCFRGSDSGLFTPETHPGFSPDVCALLNTPIEECDPDLLCLVLAVFAGHLAGNLPPELGMTDAKAVFATLCGRFGAVLGEPGPPGSPAGRAAGHAGGCGTGRAAAAFVA